MSVSPFPIKTIHVVVAVIANNCNEILIAKRPNHVHQGGRWEFPGGKVEKGETAIEALARELYEEINLTALSFQPIIQIQHNYPNKSVLLDVYSIKDFSGEIYGKEGQPVQWVRKKSLSEYQFPTANIPIIDAIRLPDIYLITPEPEQDTYNFLNQLQSHMRNGAELIQLRAKNLHSQKYEEIFNKAQTLADDYNTRLLINTSLDHAIQIGARSVHLPSSALMSLERSIPDTMFAAASCHNITEIEKANKIGVRFIVLSPVLKTTSHPGMKDLGWQNFKSLCKHSKVPVYALGGINRIDLEHAQQCGAQGVSGISGFWSIEKK